MKSKHNNNWQVKADLAEHLYGLGDGGVVPVNSGIQITSKRKMMPQIKHSSKPIKVTIQWDNQR